VRARLGERFSLADLDVRTGGPARYVRVAETGGRLGFITPLTHNFCESCNRVRVTCTGTLYMCLGQEDAADLRNPLRASEGNDLLHAAVEEAISRKPKGHDFIIDRRHSRPALARHMNVTGKSNASKQMSATNWARDRMWFCPRLHRQNANAAEIVSECGEHRIECVGPPDQRENAGRAEKPRGGPDPSPRRLERTDMRKPAAAGDLELPGEVGGGCAITTVSPDFPDRFPLLAEVCEPDRVSCPSSVWLKRS